MTEPQVEREAVEEESREKEGQVESNWPTQLTPEVEPPTLLKERPNRTEPEQKEPAKMAEAAFPSSTVDLQSASVKIKKAPTTVENLFDDVKRTESTNDAESKQAVEESKPAAAGPPEALLSSVVSAKEAINGEPKGPSPPKQVQQEEGPDASPASKLMKQDKHGSSEPAPQPAQNPTGRFVYTREVLLQIKESCKEDFPPEIKRLDCFKLNAHRDHYIVLAPLMGRVYSRDRNRDYPRKGGRSRPDSRRGRNYQHKEPVDIHKAENRWVRPNREDGETEELFRKFQGILNKLTPQKFQNLAEQALKLKIDSEEKLKGCIDKIFTRVCDRSGGGSRERERERCYTLCPKLKAIEEADYAIAYANLCKVMSIIKVEVPTEPEERPKVITFRRVLLTKCQQEFEKGRKDDEERENILIAIKETEDAEKKKQLQEDLEACEVRNRKRTLGNIRFIGELFKLNMFSETIMHECVVRLLRSSSDEESLECFTGLITTTGKYLDKPEAKTRIDLYFACIDEIIKKGKIPPRIKFMLQNIQELRENNWVPRKGQEQSLKTIDQIHHEAKVEEEREKRFVAQAFAAGSMKHGGGSERGSTKPDNWPSRGKGDRDRDRRGKNRDRARERDRDRERDKPKEKLDARKLQVLLKYREKKEPGPLILGSSGIRPQGWGRGGAGASNMAQDSAKTDKDKRPSSGTKRSDKDRLLIGHGSGSGSGSKRSHSKPTSDSQAEKALAIQAVQQVATKQQQLTHKASKLVQDGMDEATVRRKTVIIVDNLVKNKDFKEAIVCVCEMKSPGKMNFLISEAINHSLEKSSQYREFSGKLFNKLVQGRQVSEAKFMEGLNEVLEFAEDMAMDIPKFWDYLGEILSPIVSQSTLSLSFLGSMYPSLLSSGKAGVLAARVLVHCRSQLSSDEEVARLWSSASLEWSALGVASDELGEFLSSHGLTYLWGSQQLSPDNQPLKYVTELTHQCRASDTTNEDIAVWIEVDLHKAEHRWVRPKREDGETGELLRKFQGILNKLTPQKFQNLAEQALLLKIDSEERLKGCIDKIFTKALEEPKLSIAYANLCKVMSTIKVDVPAEPEGKPKVITFRRVLLTKLQQEFEKDKKDDEERENMLNAIKETEDAEKKKQLESDLEICEVKNRKRSLGNIRFIGELFKLKMFSETIMHECVVRLLRSSSDEESLECFAGLITTIGKDLDHPEAKTRIDQYFSSIAEIIKKGKIPARIKFMLQDVQELRGNSWIPRQRQEQSLKTIDQIHHEAKVELEKEKQFRDRDRRDKDRDRGERDRDRDRDKPKEKLDARKLQVLLKHREKKEPGAPTFGPTSSLRPQGWGRGGAGASNAAQDSAKTDKDKRPSRISSIGTKRSDKDKLPVGRGSGSGAKRAHSTPTPDSQAERALTIQAIQQAMTRQHQPASQKQERAQPKSRGKYKALQPVQDKMNEAMVRQKVVTIVDELVENKDFKEALECVREMKSPGRMNFLVSEAINHSLEKSSQHRQFTGKLFSRLVQGRHVSAAKFMEGLNEVLEFAEDISIDIPKVWDYIGEILSPVVSQSTLSLSFLGSISSKLSSGKAGVLAAKVLVHCRSHLSSDEEVTRLWNSASLEWSTLGVASEDIGEFLSSHGLTYLQASSQPSSDSQPLEYVTELTHQCRAQGTTNEDIITWIETNVPSPVLRKPEFVSTVTAAVVKATVSDSGSAARFEEDKFSTRALLIKKYVERNKEFQLRVLYALQIAVAQLQHPPGLLYSMFNLIYDLEIVGEVEFRRWRDKGTENYGKGAAVATVKNFFDWLDSGETESDNDT